MRSCPVCGTPFDGARKTYCSANCRFKAYRARKLGISIENYGFPYHPRLCRHCERPFEVCHPLQLYCSESCKRKHYYRQRLCH